MFRNATMADLDQVAAIYDRIHTEEEAGRSTVGWIRGVYPTRQTALASIQAGDLFVAEEDGQIVATAKINQEQVPRLCQRRLEPGGQAPGSHGPPHPGGGPSGEGQGLGQPVCGLL